MPKSGLAPGTLHIVPRNLLISVTPTASGRRQTAGPSHRAVSVAVALVFICRYTGWQARAAIGVLPAESGTAILVCSCPLRALISPAVPLHSSSSSANTHHNTPNTTQPPKSNFIFNMPGCGTAGCTCADCGCAQGACNCGKCEPRTKLE